MQVLLAHSIAYRFALEPCTGRKLCTVQPPAMRDPLRGRLVGRIYSHAGVSAQADRLLKLERLCRYRRLPALSRA